MPSLEVSPVGAANAQSLDKASEQDSEGNGHSAGSKIPGRVSKWTLVVGMLVQWARGADCEKLSQSPDIVPFLDEQTSGQIEESVMDTCMLQHRRLVLRATEPSVVKGDDEEDACPSGYERITDEATCRAAMPFLEGGDPDHYNGAANEADWPKGCYMCEGASGCTNGVWFNPHETGGQKNKASPICQQGFSIEVGATIFVGDSDIDYWHSFRTGVAESYNVGIGGNTCKDVLGEIDFILGSFKPKTVVLVCGENDLAHGASTGKTYQRWLSVVGKIRASGARVIQVGTKPEPSTKNLHRDYQKYDRMIREYVVEHAVDDVLPPIVFVDSYKAFVERDNPGSLYDADELHLSSQGYDLWNEWVRLGVSNLFACVVWSGDKCEVQAPTVNLMKSSANKCPEGYENITTLAECRAAVGLVKIAGNTFVGSETDAAWPTGCYYCKGIDSCTEGTWFNEDATGQPVQGARLYCRLKL